jgi:hypothetical protein
MGGSSPTGGGLDKGTWACGRRDAGGGQGADSSVDRRRDLDGWRDLGRVRPGRVGRASDLDGAGVRLTLTGREGGRARAGHDREFDAEERGLAQ